MGWGEEPPTRRQSLDDPVLASLAKTDQLGLGIKRWDPVAAEGLKPKQIDREQAKKLHERFLKVQAAKVAAALEEETRDQGHPSLSDLRRRREEKAKAEAEMAEKEQPEDKPGDKQGEDGESEEKTHGAETQQETVDMIDAPSSEEPSMRTATAAISPLTSEALEMETKDPVTSPIAAAGTRVPTNPLDTFKETYALAQYQLILLRQPNGKQLEGRVIKQDSMRVQVALLDEFGSRTNKTTWSDVRTVRPVGGVDGKGASIRRYAYEASGIASSVTAQRLERSRARAGESEDAGSATSSSPPKKLRELEAERDDLLAAGAFTEAEPIMAELLEQQRSELGSRHEDTLWNVEMYGLLLTAFRRCDEALPMTLEVVNTRREVLGEAHPKTQLAEANLDYLQEVSAEYAHLLGASEDDARGKVDEIAALHLTQAALDHKAYASVVKPSAAQDDVSAAGTEATTSTSTSENAMPPMSEDEQKRLEEKRQLSIAANAFFREWQEKAKEEAAAAAEAAAKAQVTTEEKAKAEAMALALSLAGTQSRPRW